MNRLLFVALTTLAIAPIASAELLFSFDLGFISGTQSGRTDYITMPIASQLLNGQPGPAIFAPRRWTPDDIGRTETLTPADDPNFVAFTTALTDGKPQYLAFGFFPGPSVNITAWLQKEQLVVWGDMDDPRIDLKGYVVTSYTQRLDSLTLSNPPGNDSSFLMASETFSAFGSRVPEPTIGGILTPTLTVLLLRRKRNGFGVSRLLATPPTPL